MEAIQSFFQQIISRITRFFSPRQPDPEFKFNREPFSAPAPVKQPKQKSIKATSKQTLGELLDDLDSTFAAMKLPIDRQSWLEKDTIRGLKRMGVYVPHPWKVTASHFPNDVCVDVTKKLPSMMAISLGSDADARPSDEKVLPNTMFAVKISRLPCGVTKLPGIPYQYGYSYALAHGKNFWLRCFLVVDPLTGQITICDELLEKPQIIPIKNRRKAGVKSRCYMQRQWGKPMIEFMEDTDRTLDAAKRVTQRHFAGLVNWWRGRDSRWSVAIRKGGDRVVFSVEPAHTKTYFADRDKSIRTASGQAKKIIHYVRAHERTRNDKTVLVKEHIRGLREFDWGKYHCVITAPKFHQAALATTDCDLGASYEEGTIRKKTEVSTVAFGGMLADMEERDMRTANRYSIRR